MLNISDALLKINQYTRKPVSMNDVYIFSINVCDNIIDNDREVFSDSAIRNIAERLVGKTGCIGNSTGRIFHTEIKDTGNKLNYGAINQYIKAWAFMFKTPENKPIIQAVRDSISHKGSISCSVNKKYCSRCGANKLKNHCNCLYGYTILDDINEVYEWSFEPLLRGRI